MRVFRKGDRVSFTGVGADSGLGSWMGAPPVGTRGTVDFATAGEARSDLMVRWDGQLESYPVMGADVAHIDGDA